MNFDHGICEGICQRPARVVTFQGAKMEIDLMDRYPRTSRNSIRCARVKVSEADRVIARQFGREYFDGPRHLGMGGYHYHPRFFKPVVERMIEYYRLDEHIHLYSINFIHAYRLAMHKHAHMHVQYIALSTRLHSQLLTDTELLPLHTHIIVPLDHHCVRGVQRITIIRYSFLPWLL